MYKGLSKDILQGEMDASTIEKNIILPSGFTSEARHMMQNYRDAMAICNWMRYLNLFIIFTCNPKWLEIQR